LDFWPCNGPFCCWSKSPWWSMALQYTLRKSNMALGHPLIMRHRWFVHICPFKWY
jgi:hypothetical protein